MANKNNNGKLSMGEGTHEVSVELFALNRRRLIDALKPKNLGNAAVLLQGGDEVPLYDTDVTYNNFRQESYFMWTFGVIEPGCFGSIQIATGKQILFVPKLPESYSIWMGRLKTLADYKNKYGVDEVYYVEEIPSVLTKLEASTLLTLRGTNTDSGLTAFEAKFPGIEKFNVDHDTLFPVIANLRVIKTDLELGVIKYVVEISSEAHKKVMKMAKPGKSEYQCESEFLNHCYSVGGCRHVSYTCICGSGENGAILHYGHAAAPNDRFIKDGDICLFDMGANYFGYAADITCSFPANGKFTDDQKFIYEAVLTANMAVMNTAKPGTSWSDMHKLANITLLQELKKGNLLKGDVNEMFDAGLAAIFQPHGLGHFLGLDVHDVGGYLTGYPQRPELRGMNRLRTARALEKNMVLTIEPGCYFIDSLLDEALNNPKLSKFLNGERINEFRGFGGVRIEDDVVVTENGILNLTKVPRTVQEIEDWIAKRN